jgi:hypothetical protein
MTQSVQTVFETLRDALDVVSIPYFVTGSFGSSAHGIPRSTSDIDIVIAPSAQQLSEFLDRFPESSPPALSDSVSGALHEPLVPMMPPTHSTPGSDSIRRKTY